MKTYRERLFIASIIACCALMVPSASALTYYTVQKIPCSSPRYLHINDSGQVVGGSYYKAFIWDAAEGPSPFGYLGSRYTIMALNNVGQVVGQSDIFGWTTISYFWDPTSGLRGFEDPTVHANSLNTIGQVVGSAGEHAFTWDIHSGMQLLDSLGGSSVAVAVNDSGQIVGNSDGHAVLWEQGGDINVLSSRSDGLTVRDINNVGQVIANSRDQVFLWERNADMKVVVSNATASAINDSGQVVGSSKNERAFIWDTVNGKVDLNSLCHHSVLLNKALAINNSGQIVAIGYDSNPELYRYAFVLTPDPNAAGPFIPIDIGEIAVGDSPVRVNFSSSFRRPIVIAKMASKNHPDPCMVRVHGVDSTGFTLQIQEYEYLDGDHDQETVNYLVMEMGTHTLADGSQVEAGTLRLRRRGTPYSPITTTFNEAFDTPPVIMTSINSTRIAQAVSGRVDNVSEKGFEYRMQEQEAGSGVQRRLNDTVAYIAWQPGSGSIEGIGYTAAMAPDLVTDHQQTIDYDPPFSATPLLLADMQTTNGANTANTAVSSSTPTGFRVHVQEETSADSETTHDGEVIGYLALFQE